MSAPNSSVHAQEEDLEGISVLGRGPVHEAFADPALEKPAAPPVVSAKPPEPIEELPPDQRPEGENVQWIPGYWDWDEDMEDFIWVSGVWRDLPPGREWVPGYWTEVEGGWQRVAGYWIEAGQTELQYLPEPPPSIESGPSVESPSADHVYVPGCYVFVDTRYVWRPGYWIPSYPGWCWVPARYVWTPLGCIFLNGHWDYGLHRRGLLFAPCHIDRRFWGRSGWRFRPRHVVLESALVGAFFVNRSRGCYYFGDYFDPRYERRGFVPWVDFRIGRRVHDPLFVQYRHQYREPDRWERNLRSVYEERRRNEEARPPRDFRRDRAFDRDDGRSLVAALSRLDRERVRLTDVSESAREEIAERAKERRRAAQERQRTELGDRPEGKRPVLTDRPRTVRRSPGPGEPKAPDRSRKLQAPETPKGEPRKPKAEPGHPKFEPRPAPKDDRPDIPRRPKTAEPKGEPKTQPKAEPKGQPKLPKVEPRPQPKGEPSPKGETRPKGEVRPKIEPRPEPKPQPKAEPKRPEPKPQPKAEPRRPEPKPQPKAEPRRPEPKPQPKAEPRRPESKPQPKAELRPQPRSEPRSLPDFRPQPRTAPRPDARPERPAPRPEVRPQPRETPRPEVRAQPRATPRPEVRPQPRATPRPEARSQPRVERRSEPSSQPRESRSRESRGKGKDRD
jgi:hypothetical protein